jgi:hypothetical protein
MGALAPAPAKDFLTSFGLYIKSNFVLGSSFYDL